MKDSINQSLVDIIFENEDFAVLNKKRGEPTAPLKEGDSSLLTHFLSLGHVKEKVIGKKEIEGGLLHRLDTATMGLVLIAKTQKMFDILQDMQEHCLIEKEYLAVCDLVPSQILYCPKNIKQVNNFYTFNVTSNFCSCGKRGQRVKMLDIKDDNYFNAFLTKNKKQYETNVFIENKDEWKVLDSIFMRKNLFNRKHIVNTERIFKSDRLIKIHCVCRLKKGYRHQVRVHLSSIGLPIQGDALYNIQYIKEMGTSIEKQIADHSYPLELYAKKLTFPSPYKRMLNKNIVKQKPMELLSFSLPQLDKKTL